MSAWILSVDNVLVRRRQRQSQALLDFNFFRKKTPKRVDSKELDGVEAQILSATALRRLCLDDFGGILFSGFTTCPGAENAIRGTKKLCHQVVRFGVFFLKTCVYFFRE